MDTCLIFPLKTARDPRQRDMVADFFSHIYCMVPTGPNSRGLILTLSDFLLVLTEGFYLYSSTRHLLEKKTNLKALSIEPQFSQQFFVGRSTQPIMPKLLI